MGEPIGVRGGCEDIEVREEFEKMMIVMIVMV